MANKIREFAQGMRRIHEANGVPENEFNSVVDIVEKLKKT